MNTAIWNVIRNHSSYYSVLGIQRTATGKEIKEAYYKKAKQHHPDRNLIPGKKHNFTEIQNAYETLSNKEKKRLYDTQSLRTDAFDFNSQPYDFKKERYNYYNDNNKQHLIYLEKQIQLTILLVIILAIITSTGALIQTQKDIENKKKYENDFLINVAMDLRKEIYTKK